MFGLNEVALAALLHDTGNFLRREVGDEGFGHVFLENLGYPESVREASLQHYGHQDRGTSGSRSAVTRVIQAAYGLVSVPRQGGASGTESGPDAPLASLFNSIHLEGGPRPESGWVYRPGEYGGDGADAYFPEPDEVGTDPAARRGLADRIRQGFGQLEDPLDPDAVMNLLERHGSYARPALARVDTDDISLFDHSRVTAAIAVCIAGHLEASETEPTLEELEDREARRYLFVRGDISGVQRFIYTITSKGALRMLRARSFFLELVAEHAVAGILHRSGVPRTNVIHVGGGGFQLLLPNTDVSREAVESVSGELNDLFSNSFGRSLYLTLATLPCAASGIDGDGLGYTFGELGKALSEQKARKHHEDLHQLFSERPEPHTESCSVCTRDDVPVTEYDPGGYEAAGEETVRLCETCRMLARASRKLVDGRYLVEGGADLRIGDTSYGLSETGQGAIYALDGVGDEACLRGATPMPAARYAMRDDEREDQIMDFDKLSGSAAGASRLAVLRMDVDDLGEIFRIGLPQEMRSLDRYAALSRAFTTFFKMIVPKICAGNYENGLHLFGKGRERAATVVYSGGDDLFVVGAWSDVLELAIDIRRAFREFVCENPAVTLSGGVSIHTAGEPLYLMAEQAGVAEELAKSNEQDGRKKDSIVLFYRGSDSRTVANSVPEALFWDEVENGVVTLLQRINEFRKDGELPFPRGFTRLLMDVVDVYEQEGHLSLPRLAYALARMEEGGKLKDDERWQELKKELLKVETVRKYLRPAAYWLDLAERKGE